MAFQANGGSSGEDFLGRYFSISLVVSLRSLIALIPIFLFLTIYYALAFSVEEEITSSAYDTLPFIIWYAAVYWRIYVNILEVATLKPSNLSS